MRGYHLFSLLFYFRVVVSDKPDYRIDTLENCKPLNINWGFSKDEQTLTVTWVTKNEATKLKPIPSEWPKAGIKTCSSSSTNLLCRYNLFKVVKEKGETKRYVNDILEEPLHLWTGEEVGQPDVQKSLVFLNHSEINIIENQVKRKRRNYNIKIEKVGKSLIKFEDDKAYHTYEIPVLTEMKNIFQIQCAVGSRDQGWSGFYTIYDTNAIQNAKTKPNVPHDFSPRHIHLAVGNSSNQMSFTWSTKNKSCLKVCYLPHSGKIPTDKDENKFICEKENGSVHHFIDGGVEKRDSYIYNVLVTGLQSYSKYWYSVGCFGDENDDVSMRSLFYDFQTPPQQGSPNAIVPHKFLLVGDISYTNAPTLPAMSEDCKGMETDRCIAVLGLGDYAYDLHDANGKVGDLFMDQLQSLAAYTPFMTAMGNHDMEYNSSHYTERFRGMPLNSMKPTVESDNGIAPNNWFYSYNIGIVHFVVLSTEILWFDLKLHEENVIKEQYTWLKNDLEKANKNRENVPWIICMGHRPMYCSASGGDCSNSITGVIRSQFEHLFYGFGVDLYLSGHVHSYERLFDVYNFTSKNKTTNMAAPVYIVSGAGGQNEYPWQRANYDDGPKSYSSIIEATYGYSRLFVHNATHLNWQQIKVDPLINTDNNESKPYQRQIVDDVWLVQYHHKPFNESLYQLLLKDEESKPFENVNNQEKKKTQEKAQGKVQETPQEISIPGVIIVIILLTTALGLALFGIYKFGIKKTKNRETPEGGHPRTTGNSMINDYEDDEEDYFVSSNSHDNTIEMRSLL